MNRHFRQSSAQNWVEDLYREERHTVAEKPKLDSVKKIKTITHVAANHNDKIWSLPAPHNHADLVVLIKNSEWLLDNPKANLLDPDAQGFLDSDGNFLTRCQAMSVAIKSKQLSDPAIHVGIRLYARDIW